MTAHPITYRFDNPNIHLLAGLLSEQISPDTVPADAWQGLIPFASMHHSISMLLWAVKRHGVDTASAPVWEPITAAVRASAVRQIWFELAQKELDCAFKTAGIQAIWLKGIALAHTVYPQPVLRPMNDLDVLVAYKDREAACAIVQALGFERYEFLDISHGEHARSAEQDHHYHFRRVKDDVPLEIHYRLINDAGMTLRQPVESWLFGMVDDRLPWLPMLKPEAFLLHLCAHALIHHGEAYSYLISFLDMHLLITHKPIDWALLVDQAVQLRWSYALERSLMLTKTLFNTAVPPEVLAQLAACRLPDEDVERVLALQGDGASFQFVLRMLHGLTFAQKVRRLVSLVFPEPEYLRNRYKIPPHVALWSYYPRRWMRQGLILGTWIRQRLQWKLQRPWGNV